MARRARGDDGASAHIVSALSAADTYAVRDLRVTLGGYVPGSPAAVTNDVTQPPATTATALGKVAIPCRVAPGSPPATTRPFFLVFFRIARFTVILGIADPSRRWVAGDVVAESLRLAVAAHRVGRF